MLLKWSVRPRVSALLLSLVFLPVHFCYGSVRSKQASRYAVAHRTVVHCVKCAADAVERRQYVMIDLLLYHSNESLAETYNTTVYLYATSYAVFEQLVSTNFTGAAPNVTNMTDNQAVAITVSVAPFIHCYYFRFQFQFNGSISKGDHKPGWITYESPWNK